MEVRDGKLELDAIKLRGGRPVVVRIDPAAFDAAQGAEWPLAPCPGASVRVEPAPVVALAARTLPDPPLRFAATADRPARSEPPPRPTRRRP